MIRKFLFLTLGLAVYAGYGGQGFAYLLAAIAGSYLAGLWIPKYKFLLWLTVLFHGGMLLLVKLQPVTGMELLAPLGLSYFTLRIISYCADVYTGKIEPEYNFGRYCLYVSYLPCIFLGPIESYDRFRVMALENARITWDGISMGLARLAWGAFKKMVIASRISVVIGTIAADTQLYRGAYALLAMVLYSVQLYADFSGGIDMVLGVSGMLGVPLSENFDTPYFSQSVQEFWRRWHMTLGAWLRNYVYIPLGGSRRGKFRKLFNTVVVFLVSGLWHGIHYLVWGVLNGIFVAFGDRFQTRYKWLNQIGTFVVITFLWAFFVWPDTGTSLEMAASVFTEFHLPEFLQGFGSLGLNLGEWIVLVIAAAGLWAFDLWKQPIREKFLSLAPAGRISVACALALVVLVFGMYGLGFNAADFIYSNF